MLSLLSFPNCSALIRATSPAFCAQVLLASITLSRLAMNNMSCFLGALFYKAAPIGEEFFLCLFSVDILEIWPAILNLFESPCRNALFCTG